MRSIRRTTRSPRGAAGLLLALTLAAGSAGCGGGSDQTGSLASGAGPAEPAPAPTGTPREAADDPTAPPGSEVRRLASAAASDLSRAARSEAVKRVEQLKREAEKQVRAGGDFTMPRLVGRSLRDAQDRLQDRGSYLLDQVDATGAHRIQIEDATWKVCSQRPAPGASVKVTTVVRLETVRTTESCP